MQEDSSHSDKMHPLCTLQDVLRSILLLFGCIEAFVNTLACIDIGVGGAWLCDGRDKEVKAKHML